METQPECTTILLSGAPGTGKTTIQRMAPEFLRPRLGETAAFGTDDIYQFIDPEWLHNDARLRRVCKANCIALALSLFANGVSVVVIAGNALYDKADVNDYVAALSPLSDVYHFTLDADEDSITARMQVRGDALLHDRQFITGWRALIVQHAGSWTHFIDTSQLVPEQTLAIIVDRIQSRVGRLTHALPHPVD